MRGIIKTYLPEKQYGFIKGDDKRDYFFHNSSFKNKKQISKICENLYIEFEQKATSKGYAAVQIELIEQDINIGYEIPNTVYTSKKSQIKGWEVVDYSNWMVYGSSRHSPDDAKEDMIDGAELIGANALLDMQYYKTTGSERGRGQGTHYYTIHNFKGRAVNIAKKSPAGEYELEELKMINSNAEELKSELSKQSSSAQIKRLSFWLIILTLIGGLWMIQEDNATLGTIVLLILAYSFSHATDYDSWLKEV
ncbi:MAG: cold shock domain-containing protein [Arcobacteraceae bacterium]